MTVIAGGALIAIAIAWALFAGSSIGGGSTTQYTRWESGYQEWNQSWTDNGAQRTAFVERRVKITRTVDEDGEITDFERSEATQYRLAAMGEGISSSRWIKPSAPGILWHQPQPPVYDSLEAASSAGSAWVTATEAQLQPDPSPEPEGPQGPQQPRPELPDVGGGYSPQMPNSPATSPAGIDLTVPDSASQGVGGVDTNIGYRRSSGTFRL